MAGGKLQNQEMRISPRSECELAVHSAFTEILTKRNFTKHGMMYHKRHERLYQRIDCRITFNRNDQRSYLNITFGMYYMRRPNPSFKLGDNQLDIEKAANGLIVNDTFSRWTLSDKLKADLLAAQLREFLTTECLPWMDELSDVKIAAASLERNNNCFRAADLYMRMNEPEQARRVLQCNLDKHLNRSQSEVSRVLNVAKMHGLTLKYHSESPNWDVEGDHWYTEEAWSRCERPQHALKILSKNGLANPRLCRLSGIHMIRSSGKVLSKDQEDAINAAELFAENLISRDKMKSATYDTADTSDYIERSCHNITHTQAVMAANCCIPRDPSRYISLDNGPSFTNNSLDQNRSKKLSDFYFPTIAILRDLFGNPFRPIVVDPSIRNESVMALATSIYNSRDYSQLPILADLLEENGCNSQELLDHLRSQQQHYLGCWALDAVLGKRKK